MINRSNFQLAGALVVLGVTPLVQADQIYRFSTAVSASESIWCLAEEAIGAPSNADCNSGGWCLSMDYAGNQSNAGFLTATDFQTFSLPPGQGICEVRFNVLVRYNLNSEGKCLVRVSLEQGGQRDVQSDVIAFGQDGDCRWAFPGGGLLVSPSELGVAGGWTPELVNRLRMGVRRSTVSPATSWFRFKALRIQITTGPDSDGDGLADCVDICPNNPSNQLDCNNNGVPDCVEVADPKRDRNRDGIPDDCQCLGDFDASGAVGSEDLGILLSAWGVCGSPNARDLTGDGCVDGADLGVLLSNWGPCSG